jgi:hypothetical protein
MARVTTLRRSTSWYLDWRTTGRPDPLFWGVAVLPAIEVARWKAAGGRNSFVAYLLLTMGRISGLLPTLLSWIPATVMAAFNAWGIRSLEQDIPQLLEEVNGVLDSTATFPGSSAVLAAGSNGE